MYPELLRIGPFVVSSYGVMMALAFICGVLITSWLAEKRKIDNDEVINLSFVILLSSILGARALYVLFHLPEFEGRWIYTIWPVQKDGTVGLSGMILLGGVIGAVFASILYIRIKELPLWKVSDSVAPALAFGLFLGRIGCFLNGCCLGKPCDLPWGVPNPHHQQLGVTVGNLHIHPTQLYASAYGLFIFLLLFRFERQNYSEGLLTGSFLILYGTGRFVIDFFRFYERQMFIAGGFGLNQMISLVMFLAGVAILLIKKPVRLSPDNRINA